MLIASHFTHAYFSVEQADAPYRENARRTNALRSFLQSIGMPLERIDGQYEGVREQSFYIPSVRLAIELARAAGQESILICQDMALRGSPGHAAFYYIASNRLDDAGKLVTSERQPDNVPGWSYHIERDFYTFLS